MKLRYVTGAQHFIHFPVLRQILTPQVILPAGLWKSHPGYNVGIRRVSSVQSFPTAFLMSSFTPAKTGAGITI